MNPRSLRRTGVVAGLSTALALAGGAPALGASGWAPTGSMADGRSAHVAALLPDGDVLAISGFDTSGDL
jgi:hypothetical protein